MSLQLFCFKPLTPSRLYHLCSITLACCNDVALDVSFDTIISLGTNSAILISIGILAHLGRNFAQASSTEYLTLEIFSWPVSLY